MAAVIKNHQHLIDFMESRDNLVPDSETCVEAADLLITIRQKKFMFILYVVQRILLMLRYNLSIDNYKVCVCVCVSVP